MTGDTELSRLLLEFGKADSNDDGSDGGKDEEGEGSSSEDTAVEEPKHELRDLSDADRLKASLALMQKSELVPIEEQKHNTLKQLKRSTRPNRERREQGSVKWSVYGEYIKANGYFGITLFLATIIAQQALNVGTNVWLKNWAQRNSEAGNNGPLSYYLVIYGLLGLGGSTMFLLNGIFLYSVNVIRSAKSE